MYKEMNKQTKQYVGIITNCFYRKAWGDSTDVGTVEELWGPNDNKVTTTSAGPLVSLLVHPFIQPFIHISSFHPFFHYSIHPFICFICLPSLLSASSTFNAYTFRNRSSTGYNNTRDDSSCSYF